MNYERIYNQIVERARSENRKKLKDGIYYERHHIIPKCLGGTNDDVNLVLLTAREHFICHQLLCDIYPNNRLLIHALWLMINGFKSKSQTRDYKVSSRIYEQLKIKRRIALQTFNSHRKNKTHEDIYGKDKANDIKLKISATLKEKGIKPPSRLGCKMPADSISRMLESRKSNPRTKDSYKQSVNKSKKTKLDRYGDENYNASKKYFFNNEEERDEFMKTKRKEYYLKNRDRILEYVKNRRLKKNKKFFSF
jgi:hypothetical protein